MTVHIYIDCQPVTEIQSHQSSYDSSKPKLTIVLRISYSTAKKKFSYIYLSVYHRYSNSSILLLLNSQEFIFRENTSKTKVMEEITAQAPKPNEFPIPPFEAYATTDMKTWEAIEFLTTKLEPVRLEDIDPENRECAICLKEYCVSEDAKLSHPPVKTPCGHIFGQSCIVWWLDPLCYWGSTEGRVPKLWGMDTSLVEDAKTSCPACRREFFPKANREPMNLLAARLWLWDNSYAYAGIARCEKEERTREHLWKYVNYCHSLNEFVLSSSLQYEIFAIGLSLLEEYAARLNTIPGVTLSPLQKCLKKKLEELGELCVSDFMFALEDGSLIPFTFDPTEALEGCKEFVEEESHDDEEFPPRA